MTRLRRVLLAVVVTALLLVGTASVALAGDDDPLVSTPASGGRAAALAALPGEDGPIITEPQAGG
jgi:hypothetical protein